jgi:hypothetical protein
VKSGDVKAWSRYVSGRISRCMKVSAIKSRNKDMRQGGLA